MTKKGLVRVVRNYSELPVTEYKGFIQLVHELLDEDDIRELGHPGFCHCKHCMHEYVLHLILAGRLRASAKLLKSVSNLEMKHELIEAICQRAAMEG